MRAVDPRDIDRATLEEAIRHHVRYSLGKAWPDASARDLLLAVSLATRDVLVDRMLATEARYRAVGAKRLYYLSLEFLMGRSLGNNLVSLGLLDVARSVFDALGTDLERILAREADAALGNGGLGRLAACFLDSLATLDLPGFGYGINYEFGLFRQEIADGEQVEEPDPWRRFGTSWLLARPEEACLVPTYGRIQHGADGRSYWLDTRPVVGLPYDFPVVGHGGHTVNTLRLFAARATADFDIEDFNRGSYLAAVEEKIFSETISKVLYPPDSHDAGRELRLLQEYFFVACAVRDILRRHLSAHTDFCDLPDRVQVQLNDTHPALAVPELVRIMVDEHDVPFEKAFDLARRTFAYTNHTLLPEALERWPAGLFRKVVPRHYEIVDDINRRFLDEVRLRHGDDPGRLARLSILEGGEAGSVHMAKLAIVGSHSVNGVARLHTELIKTALVPDFHQLWPERFNNKTNGITPRRWLLVANPDLAELVTGAIGDGWVHDLGQIAALEPLAEDPEFRAAFRGVKRANKQRLAAGIRELTGHVVDPESLFDVQVKRIHEYKRQLLAAMHAIDLYLSIVEDGVAPVVPRTVIFAGKAAPEYFVAKRVIHLLNAIATTVNADPRARGLLSVVFLPDYRVSLAERIIPGADLSEQISTAGKEASGTGNMKLALNGALTIGTLDGANIEIREAVGDENIYIFGLRVDESRALRESGYDPGEHCRRSPRLARVVESLVSGRFHPDPGTFRPLHDNLLAHGDPYFHLADFGSYWDAQRRAEADFSDPDSWDRMAVLNVARMGPFSSDRAIREYAKEIWQLDPVA
jgi:starch phosphorylase